MKEVKIHGTIGYDWWREDYATLKTVKEQLKGLKDGEEVTVSVNSPGGDVYEMIVIFNYLRDIAKAHKVSVRVVGIAMSAASYIALAARTVDKDAPFTVSDNSVVMIHNPWAFAMGDYRELAKEAEYLEKLSEVYAQAHSLTSGKTLEEIREAMDKETFYVGKEIQDAGFANNFDAIELEESGASREARDSLVVNARVSFNNMSAKIQEFGIGARPHDIAALVNDGTFFGEFFREESPCHKKGLKESPSARSISPPFGAGGGDPFSENSNGGREKMKPEELMAKDRECYDAILALGEQAGLEKERKRVLAHLRRGEKTGAMKIAAKHIESGKSVSDEDVSDEYLDAALAAKQSADRLGDNPPPLRTGDAGDEDKRLNAAFDAGFQGRDIRGQSWE